MSYTTIKALWPSEKHEDYKELGNSWGTAPVVWDALCEQYLDGALWSTGIKEDFELWSLWKNKAVPIHHRAVLMMTFDRAYVTKKNYDRAAKDIMQFLSDFEIKRENVNHWPTIAALYKSKPDIPAIGLYCTSVSEDPFEGEWNEEKEEYDQTDWSACYDLYSKLDKLED
jgi:hypothetical protein